MVLGWVLPPRPANHPRTLDLKKGHTSHRFHTSTQTGKTSCLFGVKYWITSPDGSQQRPASCHVAPLPWACHSVLVNTLPVWIFVHLLSNHTPRRVCACVCKAKWKSEAARSDYCRSAPYPAVSTVWQTRGLRGTDPARPSIWKSIRTRHHLGYRDWLRWTHDLSWANGRLPGHVWEQAFLGEQAICK